MPGLFSRITPARPSPTPSTSRPMGGQPTHPDVTPGLLALVQELFHAVEQFVIATPDLDTPRFLQRLRSTAAKLTSNADAETLTLFRGWVASALPTFGKLQREYVTERELELRRLLDLYAQTISRNAAQDEALAQLLRETHQNVRATVRLSDLAALREDVQRLLGEAREAIRKKEREEKAMLRALAAEAARLESQLAEARGLANLDALTGIQHRGMLHQRLSELLEARTPYTMALLDVDSFRTINDTLGHAVGDQLLISVAQQLKRTVRAVDTLIRYGGDEFCLLSTGMSPEQMAQRLAPCVVKRHVRLEIDDHVVSVGLSLSGCILRSQPDDTLDTFLKRAHESLKRAKQQGAGGVRYVSDPPSAP